MFSVANVLWGSEESQLPGWARSQRGRISTEREKMFVIWEDVGHNSSDLGFTNLQDLQDLVVKNKGLLGYGWMNIPLVYNQLVTLAVHVYFCVTLLVRQYLTPTRYIGANGDYIKVKPLELWTFQAMMIQLVTFTFLSSPSCSLCFTLAGLMWQKCWRWWLWFKLYNWKEFSNKLFDGWWKWRRRHWCRWYLWK